MSYDYQSAIQAGANPTDVMNYMATQTGYNAQGAVSAGANPQDVMAYMANLNPSTTSTSQPIATSTSPLAPINSMLSATPAQRMGGVNNVLNGIFPNSSLGKIVGTPLGGLLTAVTDPKDLKYYDWNPHASAGGVAGDVAGDVINGASLMLAPETGGTSLLARMGINAGIGGGLSLANSASQGQNLLSPSALENAAGSATLSSLFPVLGEGVSSLSNATKAASGVTPQIANILQDTTPEELDQYINSATGHNTNLNTPTPIGLASTKLGEATDIITQKIKDAGAAVGAAIKQSGSILMGINPETQNPFTDDILSSFNQKLESTFGHEINYRSPDDTTLKIGGETMGFDQSTEPTLEPLPGRSRTIVPADQNRILAIHGQLTALADNPTVARASDVVHNLDDLIDYSKVDQVGINHDPLQGIIRSMRGMVNDAIRTSAPAVAAANDVFSHLKDIEEGIGQMAGKNMQRGELLLRRVFSGDKSGQSLQLLNDIKNETGIDLIKQAGLAKFATENFGDDSSRTLLQQALNAEGSLAGGMRRALLAPIKNATSALIVPNTAAYARNITQGGKYANLLDELLNSAAGRGLTRTYLGNVSAAHPQIGLGVDRSIQNLIYNTIGVH